MITIWGVDGDETKMTDPFFAHPLDFATSAEVQAFKKGLEAASTGKWHAFMAYDTKEEAEKAAADLNKPNYECE